MNIGMAAKRSGLTVKTVRYYANIGMVVPAQDGRTGYRDYSEDDVARLQFIGKARRLISALMNAVNCSRFMMIRISPAVR